jgi:hypothetical protein
MGKSEAVNPPGNRTRSRIVKTSTSVNRFEALLLQARELIESICERTGQTCPSTLAQAMGFIVSETRLLSALTTEPDANQNEALKTMMLLGNVFCDWSD